MKKTIMWKKRSKNGVTLVEMMIVVAIFTLLMGGIYMVMAAGEDSWHLNKTRVELQQELRRGMEWMLPDLREAGPSSITNVPADGAWYTTITFKTPSGVTGGTLTWNVNSIQLVRGGTGSIQLQRIENGTTKVIAQNLSSLQFRRQASSSDILEVSMQGSKSTVQGTPVTYQLDFSIQLRN